MDDMEEGSSSPADEGIGRQRVQKELVSERELRRYRMDEFYQLTHILFTKPERLILYKILKDYQKRRDIDRFIVGLKLLLRTYTKLELLKYIRYFLWEGHIQAFDRQTQFHRHFRPRKEGGDNHRHSQEHLSVVSASTSASSKKYKDVRVFTIQKEPGEQSLGFSVRGGSEHGLGIYVSDLDQGSATENSGLQVGDKILEVNNISLKGVASSSAVRVLTGAQRLKLVVQRTRKIPEWRLSREKTSWYDVHDGRVISGEFEECGISHNIRGLDVGTPERRINLKFSRADKTLGFNIRGGREYGLGIYVSKLDRGGLANKNGVRVGDQIIDVNGIPFDNITHGHAVEVLKGKRHLILTLRDVRRFPVYKLYAEYTWSDGQIKTATSLTSLREARITHEANRSKAPSVSDLFSRNRPSGLQSEIFLPKGNMEQIDLNAASDNDDSDSLINLDQWARDIRDDSARDNHGYMSEDEQEVVIHIHSANDDELQVNPGPRRESLPGHVSINDQLSEGGFNEDESEYAVADSIYATIKKNSERSQTSLVDNNVSSDQELYGSQWSTRSNDNNVSTKNNEERYLSTQSLEAGRLVIPVQDPPSHSSGSLHSGGVGSGSTINESTVPKVEGALYSQIRRKSVGSFSNLSQTYSEKTTLKRDGIYNSSPTRGSRESVKFSLANEQMLDSHEVRSQSRSSNVSDLSDDDASKTSDSDDNRSKASTSRSYNISSSLATKNKVKRSKKTLKNPEYTGKSISDGVYASSTRRYSNHDVSKQNGVNETESVEVRLQELQHRQTAIGVQELNSLSPSNSDDVDSGSTRKKGKFKVIKDKIKASLRIKKTKRPSLQGTETDVSGTFRGGSVKNVINSYNMAILEDSAREMQTSDEFEAVMRHIKIYHDNHDLERLVEVLLCLLDKPEKLMLLKDIRGVIYPLDVARFDTMVNQYEIEAYQKLSLKLHLPLNHKPQKKPRRTLMTTEIGTDEDGTGSEESFDNTPAEDGHFHIRSMDQTDKQREVVGVLQNYSTPRRSNPTSPKRKDLRDPDDGHAAISHFGFLDDDQNDITNRMVIISDEEPAGEVERIPGTVVIHLSKTKPSLGLDFIEEEVGGVREVKIDRIDAAGAANDDSVIEVGMTLLAVDRHRVERCPLDEVQAILDRSYADKHYVTMKLVFHKEESTQF